MNALKDFDEDQNRELSQDELEAAENDARIKGDERTANALDFAGNNFDNLQLSGKNDSLFSNHDGITQEDISELTNYDSYLSNGSWLTTSPLVSESTVDRGAAIGATLGGIIQGLSYLTGVGQGITTYATYAGAAGGGIGIGGYAGYKAYESGNKEVSTTAGIAVGLGVGVGVGIVGAWSGGLAGMFWGPSIGHTVGGYGTQRLGEKVWNWRHRNEYESMYGQMRRL